MAVCDREMIDIVAFDPFSQEVLLVMVEDRPWGSEGERLFDLQEKFSLYFGYAIGGQLREQYPQAIGRAIRFELRSIEPLGPRERELVNLVLKNHLEPAGIQFSARVLGDGKVH